MAASYPASTPESTVRLRRLSGAFQATLESIHDMNLYEPGSAQSLQIDRVPIRGGFPGRVWIAGRGIRLGIPVDLRPGDGEIVAAVADNLPIFGVGVTFVEAIEDLRMALTDHLQTLDATEDLTDDLQAQRQYLRLHLAA